MPAKSRVALSASASVSDSCSGVLSIAEGTCMVYAGSDASAAGTASPSEDRMISLSAESSVTIVWPRAEASTVGSW